MTFYDFLLLGAKSFSALFVFGVALVVLEPIDDDDDDDLGGGKLIPCYQQSR